ncbi:hypothetical protein ACFQU2_12000 [Siccirubricoccus deserti]
MLPFALGNLAGPLVLGRFFDTIGRRPMITATYALAGVLMAATGFAFAAGWLSAWEQTAAWTVIFFFASAAASAAYLTVGESFPLEIGRWQSRCSMPSAREWAGWSGRRCSAG